MIPGRPHHITDITDDGLLAAGAAVLQNIVINAPASGETATIYNTNDVGVLTDVVAVIALDDMDALPFNTYLAAGVAVIVSGACDITVVVG